MTARLHHLTRLRPTLHGPPPAVPRPLDRAAEWWARLGPRLRMTLLALAALVAVGALGFRLVSSPWGHPTTVVVARHDLPLGHTLTRDDLVRTTWPADLVPPDALSAPPDGRLATRVLAGAVLTARHLDVDGPRGALAAGEAAVAIPAELLPAVPADALLDLVGAGHDGAGEVLAADVAVLAVDDGRIWVAVPRSTAAEVAAAAASGALTGVLLPP